MFCLRISSRLTKYEEKLLGSGCLRIKICIRGPFFGLYLLCVHPEVVELILEELHEGICGSHTGGKSLSHRVLTQGYWWPNMQKEAQDCAKKCDQYQWFAPNIHQPGGVLNPLSSPWSFA